MDMEFWKFAFQVLTFFLTGGIGIYVYLSNKDKVTNDRIGKLEDDLDAKLDVHVERIAKLEAHADSTPGHEEIGDLHDRINVVSSGVDRLTGELSGIKTTLNLIHEFLLRGSK